MKRESLCVSQTVSCFQLHNKKIVYAFLIDTVCAACPLHLILFNLITAMRTDFRRILVTGQSPAQGVLTKYLKRCILSEEINS
jgi:hypothetical protein